jgi:type II secretory pathway component GspD/PulD (secretin)
VNAFVELNNALIIRYSDPALFQDALHMIEELDKPQKQVNIETKFVEVNETRAKEFGADFSIEGLGSGRSVDWNTQTINSRFAQDVDQWSSPLNPPLVSPASAANLLTGPTAIDAVIGTFPYINLQLRFLEAEGILNVINGPRVTALDNREAEFRIEEYEPQQSTIAQNTLQNVINPLDQAYTSLQLSAEGRDDVQNSNMVTAVVLRMTPQITSPDSITLNDLIAELLDFEGYVASTVTPIVQNVTQAAAGGTNQTLFSTTLAPTAQVYSPPVPLVKRKKIETYARIKNGGTVVIGGWTGERTQELTTGIPVLRDMPFFGKLLFSKAQRSSDRTTLMIFLTGNLVE